MAQLVKTLAVKPYNLSTIPSGLLVLWPPPHRLINKGGRYLKIHHTISIWLPYPSFTSQLWQVAAPRGLFRRAPCPITATHWACVHLHTHQLGVLVLYDVNRARSGYSALCFFFPPQAEVLALSRSKTWCHSYRSSSLDVSEVRQQSSPVRG